MELKQLELDLIDYYKKHTSEFVQDITVGYIKSNYPENSYKKLHLAILKSHPHSWGFPDVSAIETAVDRFMKSENTTLKNKKEVKEYHTPIKPLTDEELIELDESDARDKWKYMINKAANDKAVKKTDILCDSCVYIPTQDGDGFKVHEKCTTCFNPKTGNRANYEEDKK